MTSPGTISQYLGIPGLAEPLASRVFIHTVDYKRKIVFTTRLPGGKTYEKVSYDKRTHELYSDTHPRAARRPGVKPEHASGRKTKATFHMSQESMACLRVAAKANEEANMLAHGRSDAPTAYGEIIGAALRAQYPASYFSLDPIQPATK